MADKNHSRRSVLQLSGTTLAALGGVSFLGSANASSDTDCVGCGDGGDDGGGGSTGSPPSVTTRTADVYSDYATLRGSLDSLGDDDSADVWFEWGPEGDGLPYDTNLAIKDSLGWYSFNTWDDLSSGTYEYRAAGSNDWGKSEGYTRTFTI